MKLIANACFCLVAELQKLFLDLHRVPSKSQRLSTLTFKEEKNNDSVRVLIFKSPNLCCFAVIHCRPGLAAHAEKVTTAIDVYEKKHG